MMMDGSVKFMTDSVDLDLWRASEREMAERSLKLSCRTVSKHRIAFCIHFLFITALCQLIGCGGAPELEKPRPSAYQAIDDGNEFLKTGQYVEAEEAFRIARSGPISPDYVVEVVGGLSKSLAGQSKIDEALALVEKVREGTSSERSTT